MSQSGDPRCRNLKTQGVAICRPKVSQSGDHAPHRRLEDFPSGSGGPSCGETGKDQGRRWRRCLRRRSCHGASGATAVAEYKIVNHNPSVLSPRSAVDNHFCNCNEDPEVIKSYLSNSTFFIYNCSNSKISLDQNLHKGSCTNIVGHQPFFRQRFLHA